MSISSSSSRAAELLQEFITLGAERLMFQTVGTNAKFAFVTQGHLHQELERVIPDFEEFVGELKALITEMTHEGEYDWRGHFPFSAQEGDVWIGVEWSGSRQGGVLFVSVLGELLSLPHLGLGERDTKILEELISFPSGVIVGCGGGYGGHSTTFKVLLERLAQKGKRVVSFDWYDPRLHGVSQFDIDEKNFSEQVMARADGFDVVALGCLNWERGREAIDLAARGHLVLGLIYGWSATSPFSGLLRADASPDEIRAHFLGGWSQTLVRRADGQGRIGLFSCMSRAEALTQVVDLEWHRGHGDAIQTQGLWRDAEEKIAAGLITREDAVKHLPRSY